MKNLLICNCCGDERIAPISMYLMKNKLSWVMSGVEKTAEEREADILYFLPEGAAIDGLNGEVKYGTESLVTCNAFAILQELNGSLPRPMLCDDLIPEYEGKAVSLITPEEAYAAAAGEDKKFVYVIRDGKSEIMETAVGSKAADLVDAEGAKAVLLGGLRGRFVLPGELDGYEIARDPMYDSITVYSGKDCMVDVTARLMHDAWEASCGKCVLCREGSLQFQTITAEMTQGKARAADPELLQEVGELIQIGAYCAFGKRMPGPLLSALELFPEEFEEHIRKKSCRAGVCYKAEAVYVILPDLCAGCGDCMDACEEDAIRGKKGFIHMIDQDMCESCGKCTDACEEGAITAVTGKMPKLPKKLTKVGKF